MKTFFLKTSMPIMVFILAIVFAFASDKKEDNKEQTIPGFIFKDGQCISAKRTCSNTAGPACLEDGLIVHRLESTFCDEPMTNWF